MIDGISNPSVSERIQLVEDIWDTIASFPEELSVSQAQRQELDRRLEVYHRRPQGGVSWQDVRANIDRV